jgi:hypothetical protein
MKMTIESTDLIGTVNGVQARIWKGTTERGVKVQVLISRIGVLAGEDEAQFKEELEQVHAPMTEPLAFPMRMLL